MEEHNDYRKGPYHVLVLIWYRPENLLDKVCHDDIALLLERVRRTERQLR